MVRIYTRIKQQITLVKMTVVARVSTRIKQLIAVVKMKFGRQSDEVAAALESATPGTALRALILEGENENNPKLVAEALNASAARNLKGRP